MKTPRITAYGAWLAVVLLVGPPPFAADTVTDPPVNPHGDFDGDCSQCHSATGWTPARVGSEFNHAKTSGFPLQHSHRQTDCSACHVSLDFAATDPACSSCHVDIHRNELGKDCSRCHSSRSFIDPSQMATAHLATRFPLRGLHRTVDCEECHEPGGAGSLQWVNTATDCESCHLSNYLATTNPDHVAGSFPRSCEQCHSSVGWRPAGFNHNSLAAGTACVDCHLTDYQGTTNPIHLQVGFPQTCETCHNTHAWTPTLTGSFNHDGLYFPIYSGRHNGRWNACSDCHTNPSNFMQFTCLDCHEHNDPQEVAGHHSGISGYLYDSQACLSCHPDGNQ